MKIENVEVDNTSQYAACFAVCCVHNGARYHIWVDKKTKEVQPTLFKNSMAEINQPGYFTTRRLRTDSAFGKEMVSLLMKAADEGDLFAKSDEALQAKLAAEKQEQQQAALTYQAKQAGPWLLAILFQYRNWLGTNVTALLTAAAVCDTHNCPATAKALGEIAAEMETQRGCIQIAIAEAGGVTVLKGKRYWAKRQDGDAHVFVVENGQTKPLPLRLDVMNASPDGFEWGYAGSGPHQLALALCIDALGGNENTNPFPFPYTKDAITIIEQARNIYTYIVPQLSSRRGPQHKNDEWCISVEDVLGWILKAVEITKDKAVQ